MVSRKKHKQPKLLDYFFLRFKLTKNRLGYISGDFFKASSGVDVMITIFCHFHQISSNKLAFFLKTNVMIHFLHNSAVFLSQKRQFFRPFFGENILKS
jgi:hypothetical protein